MREILLLIEIPSQRYTNGIAESNLRLMKERKTFCNVYFFEDRPFHNKKIYFLSKLLSLIYFLKNYIIFILKRVKKGFKKFDYFYIVISVNSPLGILKNFIQIILLRPFSEKLVVHIHRSDINDYNYTLKIISTLQQYILSWASKILVLSNKLSFSNAMVNHKSKVFVLGNSLDPELESLLLQLEINVPLDILQTRFFFYSNILPSKGINLYLNLFKENKFLNKEFSRVAGFPNDKKLVNYIKDNNHKFLGHISRDTKRKLFLNNDCIIFCSPNEGAPLILLEAMASGVFIISTNVGFIPELLGENYPFMSDPNIKDISKLIDKYSILSENERYNIILQQRRRYIKLFSYKKWTEKTKNIFNDN